MLKARRIKLTPHFAFARRRVTHLRVVLLLRDCCAKVLCATLLRLKAVLWRGLCNGQQRCRLWPPVGRAHLDSEEGEDQAGETHESSRRCQERVLLRPSIARSSGTSGVVGLSGRTLRGRLLRELSLKRGFECIAHLSARIKTSSISATRNLGRSDRSWHVYS